jgi:hypothetical protein
MAMSVVYSGNLHSTARRIIGTIHTFLEFIEINLLYVAIAIEIDVFTFLTAGLTATA